MTDKAGEEKKVDVRSGRALQAALLLLVIGVVLAIAGSPVAGVMFLGALACFIVSVVLAPPGR